MMNIAIIGSRGIPAEFGGFETFAEELAVRLVQRGCQVTVFCENSQQYRQSVYKGVQLCHIRTPNIAGLRSIWSDLTGIVTCLQGYDVVYMLGYHTAFLFFLPCMFGVNFFVNMDGLEWQRKKWSSFIRAYLKVCERLAVYCVPHLIADAKAITDYLTSTYPGSALKFNTIPYGAIIPEDTDPDAVRELGLMPDTYDLVVCRLEPENHVLEIIEGYAASSSDRTLVIVGDHHSGSDYVDTLLQVAGDRVKFLGTIFDSYKLTVLRQHCRAYLHGHSVGGTNPSLLEAMSCGNYVIAHDNPFNREVLADRGRFFRDAEGVTKHIDDLDARGISPEFGKAMKERIRKKYDWETITDLYLQRFFETCKTGR
ncbi:glycosyl transferase family 1 [Candidatus Magnetomorum sp. HK-1]|nr:glycosyl transferase family 1 [Candidatus Magnetomorum sp. HK-1]